MRVKWLNDLMVNSLTKNFDDLSLVIGNIKLPSPSNNFSITICGDTLPLNVRIWIFKLISIDYRSNWGYWALAHFESHQKTLNEKGVRFLWFYSTHFKCLSPLWLQTIYWCFPELFIWTNIWWQRWDSWK